MFPQALQAPTAFVFFMIGMLACLAGYRLFKVVIAIYGFVIGAVAAHTMLDVTNTVGMVLSTVIGGIAGAVILVFAYFVGIALVGASLGALVGHVGWNAFAATDPPLGVLVGLVVLGALGAMILQRYVLIIGTSFGGAWVAILSIQTMSGDSGALNGLAKGDLSMLYPPVPGTAPDWVPISWLMLGLVGIIVQLGITGRGPSK